MHYHNADPIVRNYVAIAELNVSATTYYRWAKLGIIRPVKIGPRASGIRRSELERIKNGQQSAA